MQHGKPEIRVIRHGDQISKQTVLRRIKERGMQPCHPYVGPKLTPRYLTCCRNRKFWNAAQWRQVLFTDETLFTLKHSMGEHVFSVRRQIVLGVVL